MVPIAKSAFLQLGIFVFLEILIFGSDVFVGGTGESQHTALRFFLLTFTTVMVLGEIAFNVAETSRKQAAQRLPLMCALILPMVGFVISLGLGLAGIGDTESTDLIAVLGVSLCLGLAMLAQIHVFTWDGSLDSQGLLLSSGLSILIGLLYIHVMYLISGSSRFFLLAALAFLMVVSGIALTIPSRNADAAAPPQSPAPDGHDPSQRTHIIPIVPQDRLTEMFPILVPMALEALLCASSLGINWHSNYIQDTGLLLCILVVFLVCIAAFYHMWKKSADVSTLVLCGAFTLAIPIALSIFQGAMPADASQAVAMLSHLLFLLLIWSSAMMLGRIDAALSKAASWSIIAFLLVFSLFTLFEDVASTWVKQNIMSFLALVFLLYLSWFFSTHRQELSRQASATAQDDERNTESELGDEGAEGAVPQRIDTALRKRCDRLAAEHRLSPREAEILPLLAAGLSSTAIANRMMISPGTVKTHRHRIYEKVGVHTHEELVETLELVP
jgi:DNA-binding CsgD family transcriptional regulator